MDLRFNSLKRGKTYSFWFIGGGWRGTAHAITGVLHEVLPDGCLKVVGSIDGITSNGTYYLNPDTIAHAREI